MNESFPIYERVMPDILRRDDSSLTGMQMSDANVYVPMSHVSHTLSRRQKSHMYG